MTVTPRVIGERQVEDLKEVLLCLNRDVLPLLNQYARKLGGMMGNVPLGSLSIYDGQSWRPLSVGAYAALPDSDSSLLLSLGQCWIALPRSLSSGHTYTLSATGASAPDAMSFYNFTTQALTVAGSSLGSMQFAECTFGGGVWSMVRRYNISVSPEFK